MYLHLAGVYGETYFWYRRIGKTAALRNNLITFKSVFQHPFYVGAFQPFHSAPDNYNYITALRQNIAAWIRCRAHYPAQSVAAGRVSDFFGDGYAQALFWSIVFFPVNAHCRQNHAFPLMVCPAEAYIFLDAFNFHNFFAITVQRILNKKRLWRSPLLLMRQSYSALCTSSCQNLSAIGSSHSFSEAVNFASLSFFRLICANHCNPSWLYSWGSFSFILR